MLQSLAVREMKIKTTTRYYHPPTRMIKKNKGGAPGWLNQLSAPIGSRDDLMRSSPESGYTLRVEPAWDSLCVPPPLTCTHMCTFFKINKLAFFFVFKEHSRESVAMVMGGIRTLTHWGDSVKPKKPRPVGIT